LGDVVVLLDEDFQPVGEGFGVDFGGLGGGEGVEGGLINLRRLLQPSPSG